VSYVKGSLYQQFDISENILINTSVFHRLQLVHSAWP